MKLSKEDSLFLYGILFHLSAFRELDPEVENKVSSILSDLSRYFLENDDLERIVEDKNAELDDIIRIDDTIDEDSEKPKKKNESYVSACSLDRLSPVTVVTPAGDKATFEFEDVEKADSVDVLVDEGTVIISGVSRIHVTRDLKSIRLYDGQEWHDFRVKKFPKSWTKVLVPDEEFLVGMEAK
jgi:hypothetical protein